MKDTFWFKHDMDAHTDPKMKILRKYYGWRGYGWFWFIVEKLRSSSNYKMEYNDLTFESLSIDMDCTIEEVQSFIDDCMKYSLLAFERDSFQSPRLTGSMQTYDAIRELRSMAGRKSGEVRQQHKETTPEKPPQRVTAKHPHALKEKVIIYPECENVKVTPAELEKLQAQFPDAVLKDKVEALSLYKKSTGKTYKDDYATILTWERMDKKKGEMTNGNSKGHTRQIPPRDQYTPDGS